jgi:hypothetical protein
MSFTNIAQEHAPSLSIFHPKYELNISYGFFPVIGYGTPISYTSPGEPLLIYENIKRDIDVIQIGNFIFQYQYHYDKKHSTGITASFLLRNYRKGQENNRKSFGQNCYITFQGNYRYTYKRYTNCSLYSALSVGAVLYFIDPKIKEDLQLPPGSTFLFLNPHDSYPSTFLSPSAHLTLLGFRIGKANASQIELGFGTQGILKVGYSYQF